VRAVAPLRLLAAAFALAAADASALPPPCAAEVGVEPEAALVGQQILYRVRILRREDVDRVDWVQPPVFPNLRAEWLPGRAEDTRATRDGARYRVREDQRALFAARPGRLEIPRFALRCGGAEIEVPGVRLEVHAPPERGRPADFAGLIGPLSVQTSAEPPAIALGESVRVSVLVRGDSNLWDLEVPFAGLEGAGLAVFAERPGLDLEAGERLYVRRSFRFDLVPREEGRLSVPEVRVPYYDAKARRYAVARGEPLSIEVGPRRAQEVRALPEESGRGDGAPHASAMPLLGLAAAAAALGAAAAARIAHRRRMARAEIDAALDVAARRRAARDAAGEAAALAKALARAAELAPAARRAALADEIEAELSRLAVTRFAAAAGEPQRESCLGLIGRLR
jgi:hypothetical protein